MEEERRRGARSAQLLPPGGRRPACGPLGAVLSPCGGFDGQHVFSSSACRCNGLTVSSLKVCGLMQWTDAVAEALTGPAGLFLFLLFFLPLAEFQPKRQN